MKLLHRRHKVRQSRQRAAPPRPERSSGAYSYYSQQRSEEPGNTGRQVNRVIDTAKTKAKVVHRFWLQRFGLVILIIVAIICVVDVLSLSSNPKIIATDSNTDLQNQAAYQAAANKLLSSIWNRNKITVDTAGISRQLSQEFPELTSVSMTLPLMAHRPLIYVQTAQPALVLAAANGQFEIGTTGKVLLATSSNPLGLPVVTDQSGIQAHLGRQAMSSDDISFIQTVVYELKAKQIVLSNMTLPAHSRELDVHITGVPYYVKFNLASNDARQQAGTFLAVYDSLKAQNITPSTYIDVRVDGRAYYE